MSVKDPKPRRCIHANPTSKSILFCGEFIHLPTLAMITDLSEGYISKVFSRKRVPSLATTQKIATALKMGLEEFVQGLQGHVATRYSLIYSRDNPKPMKELEVTHTKYVV